MASLTDPELKAIEDFRQRLIERLRGHKEECDSDPESHTFKEWLSENCSEAELSMMAAWEEAEGAPAARHFLISCQLEAQK